MKNKNTLIILVTWLLYMGEYSAQSPEYIVDVKHLVEKNNYMTNNFENCPVIAMGGWLIAT